MKPLFSSCHNLAAAFLFMMKGSDKIERGCSKMDCRTSFISHYVIADDECISDKLKDK